MTQTDLTYFENRHRDFIKVYGREPTQEELRVFIEYIELVKSGR